VSQPGAALWTYFTNDTCRPTNTPSQPCTLGYYGVYTVMASKPKHVKMSVDFARRNNLRLIIRNTGHDFIGRSVGWGSLIVNTHSFQDIEWIDKYSGPGSYTGGAVTIGAGVQGKTILTAGHARNPPLVVVTGECPTVGIAGGFIQGAGHGPWTTLKGFCEFDSSFAPQPGRHSVLTLPDSGRQCAFLRGRHCLGPVRHRQREEELGSVLGPQGRWPCLVRRHPLGHNEDLPRSPVGGC
jgi:hypothetical protein